MRAGEPIQEDDDLYGTAVIAAARIMGLASGGQVMVSGLVRRVGRGQEYHFVDRGDRVLKGLDDSVRMFELDWEGNVEISNSEAAYQVLRQNLGAEHGPGGWYRVTQEDIDRFADLTHDHQFIHVDPERAAQTPLGGTIAHGFLTLALLTHLVESIDFDPAPEQGFAMGVNYGFDRIRFINPVPAGSSIRARTVTTDVTHTGGAVNVTRTVTVEIEDESRPALVGEWIGRIVYDG